MRVWMPCIFGLALTPALTGCVAAVVAIPAATGGLMVKGRSGQETPESSAPRATRKPQKAAPAAAQSPQPVQPATPPAGMQYLYGSGEGAALSIQAFHSLLDYVDAVQLVRPLDSVVLASGATFENPAFVPCAEKPFAVVFDVDETMILNLGYEYDDARTGQGFDSARWDNWEKTGADKVAAVPGAQFAVNTLRKQGITVIFNTNRSSANADATVAAIAAAGLGSAVHGDTLFLSGDDDMGSRKDGRRWTISEKYCVIAMGGDQLGDFSDLFNQDQSVGERRNAASAAGISNLWGNGWFILPNPVYGSGVKGGFDDVFPLDKRWPDAAPVADAPPQTAPD